MNMYVNGRLQLLTMQTGLNFDQYKTTKIQLDSDSRLRTIFRIQQEKTNKMKELVKLDKTLKTPRGTLILCLFCVLLWTKVYTLIETKTGCPMNMTASIFKILIWSMHVNFVLKAQKRNLE